MSRVYAFFLHVVSSPPLVASSACNVPKNNSVGFDCLNKGALQADTDFNKAFQQLNNKRDADGKGALRADQRDRIQQRDAYRASIRTMRFT